MRQIYATSDYDEELRLKPSPFLWITVLFLSRAIALPIASGVGSFIGLNSDAIALLHGLWNLDAMAPSLIAGTILYAMLRRAPAPSKSMRWVWSHGKMFLAVAAGLDLALTLVSLHRQWDSYDPSAAPWVIAALDLYFLIYVLAARRVRDTFADFAPAFVREPGRSRINR